MSNLNIKWAALFLLLILLPASILTILSVRAFQDEQRSALVDLHLLVPLLQNSFDRTVDDIADRIVAAVPEGEPAQPSADIPEVEQIFTLDAAGQFAYPRVHPLLLTERRPAFQAALLRGEDLEFRAKDNVSAGTAYETALRDAQTDAEKAELLNALGRCAVKAGDLKRAQGLHRQLESYPPTFDADSAHPLTLSTLRLVRRLPPEGAIALLSEWMDAVLAGRYPLYPGCSQAVVAFEEAIGRRRHENRRFRSLLRDLKRVEHQTDLIEIYESLLRAGLGRRGRSFLSGTDASGKSFLVHLRPRENGTATGILFDLEKLGGALMRSPAGIDLQSRGFGLSLFDVDGASAFEDQHGAAVHLTVPASPSMYRMSMGFYSQDRLFVLTHYRRRNLLILAGIFVLAGVIVLGATMIFRDTTREVQTARLRSEFVSNVSHDLRTPLTAIRMYAETLLMGRYRTREQMQDYLRTVMQESRRLSRMVGNILDFSRMESGRKTYDFEETDLGDLVRSTAEEFDPVLKEHGFEVALELPGALPPIRIDREAIESAVANLINNAVKYSRDRKEIRIALFRREGCQVVEVADRGIGVPADEREAIFRKYHRARNAGDAATGTGLGLALVRGIADAHRGDVEVQSREGGGSVFRLILPQAGG